MSLYVTWAFPVCGWGQGANEEVVGNVPTNTGDPGHLNIARDKDKAVVVAEWRKDLSGCPLRCRYRLGRLHIRCHRSDRLLSFPLSPELAPPSPPSTSPQSMPPVTKVARKT